MSLQTTPIKSEPKAAIELLPLELWGAIANRCDDASLKTLSLVEKTIRIEALKEYNNKVISSAKKELCEKVVNIDQGSHPIQKALLNILKKAFQNENVQAEAITAYNQWILKTITTDFDEKKRDIINTINTKITSKESFKSACDSLQEAVIVKAFNRAFLAFEDPMQARQAALEEAISSQDLEVVQLILSGSRFESWYLGQLLLIATERNQPEVVQLLLKTSIISEEDRSEAALEASTQGYSSVLKIILDHGSIDPDYFAQALQVATYNQIVDCLAILNLKKA